MPNVGIFTKEADIQARAGINANATAKDHAATDVYVLNVEAAINLETGYDWSTNYAAITATCKTALTEAGACMCAINVIHQDTSGFASLEEATFMCDALAWRYGRAIKLLQDATNTKAMMGAP